MRPKSSEDCRTAQSFTTKTKPEADSVISIYQSVMYLAELTCSLASVSFQGFKFLLIQSDGKDSNYYDRGACASRIGKANGNLLLCICLGQKLARTARDNHSGSKAQSTPAFHFSNQLCGSLVRYDRGVDLVNSLNTTKNSVMKRSAKLWRHMFISINLYQGLHPK